MPLYKAIHDSPIHICLLHGPFHCLPLSIYWLAGMLIGGGLLYGESIRRGGTSSGLIIHKIPA